MWHIIVVLLLASSSITDASQKHHKYVTTLLNAKWQDTPVILEVAEYLNDENSDYFWKFVDLVCENEHQELYQGTDKEQYERAINLASQFLKPNKITVFKLALSLRMYSARVEMFSQMGINKPNRPDCDNFVEIGGKFACSVEDLEKYVKTPWVAGDIYSVDHLYPKSSKSDRYVMLYGQMGSVGFNELHKKLKSLAESGEIVYVLRHYVKNRPDRMLRLSGYGVELQMKSTEYKATDDSDINDSSGKKTEDLNEGVEEIEGVNFATLKKLHPELKEELETVQTELLESSSEVGAFKVWQFQDLSHQAAERIMKSPPSEALKVFTDIAQNFPMQAKSLIRTRVSSKMKKEMKKNQEIFFGDLHIQPTDTVLFINGRYFDIDLVDMMVVVETLRSEMRVMEALHKIGFTQRKIRDKLLALDLSGSSNQQDFAINIKDSAIVWVNDIEKDSRYSRWPRSFALLRSTFSRMLGSIRRNMYNLVIIVDPLSDNMSHYINTMETFYAHSAPVRIGLVFVTNTDPSATGQTDASVAINSAFRFLLRTKTAKEAIYFLSQLVRKPGANAIEVSAVRAALLEREPSANINVIFGEDSEFDVGRDLYSDFVKRTGFKTFPQALLNGAPLPSVSDSDTLEETVLSTIMTHSMMLQNAVYQDELTDDDDVIEYLMSQPNVMSRLNARVLQTEKNRWLDMVGTVLNDENVDKWSAADTAAWLVDNSKYLSTSPRLPKRRLYTYWLVVDLQTEKSRQLLREALTILATNDDARISIIINNPRSSSRMNINSVVLAALMSLPTEKSISYIKEVISEENAALIAEDEFDLREPTVIARADAQDFTLTVHKHFIESVLNFAPGEYGVISNGRVLGPLEADETFDRDDFALLQRFNNITYGEKLAKSLDAILAMDNDIEDGYVVSNDDMVMQIASLLVPRQHTRRYEINFVGDQYSAIKIPAENPDEVAFNLVAVVDPVSRGAQKLGAILTTLQQSLNCNIKVFLNCVDKNSDMPLKSFYRFVFDPELQFSSEGQSIGAIAKFTKLPTSSLLTQYIHTPENWLVEVVKSVYDLDNIKLDNVAMGVHSEFELEYLLLEGHCFEATMGNPPRGLQITLGTESQPIMVDTIVMANLGYFQLKANPGEWLLRLRQGRSADIYSIVSVTGPDVVQKDNEVRVLMSSLRSHILKIKVAKKPDKMQMDLLADDEEQSGLWNSITRTFGTDDSEEKEEKINIFSLASGHLYERFMKIMMLSVIKHTKSPVKFWFLKNYLSPTLKDFLPHMAKEYGFEYELVQYKWPRWLHQQTEKQRTIWGYKILFLDVLFPLDMKKIIFVDADQVVRADLKELVNLDLEGAPYAYTPFCDSRQEMDGFRFWKQGYWKTHLQGRSYHISALYVVDLKRFRRIAAGDRLRGQYQALSPDPNSLSNLDQDLPNNMIHQVAIKTLPQDWLWCETWCSDASKKTAKTIDLCNNPMTKEAKLQAAMRILPEWVGYDEEIKTLKHRIDSENNQLEKESEEESSGADSAKHEEL